MRTIRDSTLTEYAQWFWERERRKTRVDESVFASPVDTLRQMHPYKLPYGGDSACGVAIVEFSRDEVEDLRIHNYMLHDAWMQNRHLNPPSTRLTDLARHCLDAGYFARPDKPDIQQRRVREWREAESLDGVMATDMPLVQANVDGTFEIVDGWRRLLPSVALLLEGLEYHPFPSFLAREVAL